MQDFRQIQWECSVHTEPYHPKSRNSAQTAYWSISDWQVPFTFEDWASKLGFDIKGHSVPEHIYTYCASKMKRPYSKEMVHLAETRLFLDPEHIAAYEKMASFYILKLLACIPRNKAWKAWANIPKTEALLKDETFCLAVVAMHPVLFGKLHPISRNNRCVFLEAWANWDLPKYSIMQFVHPHSLKSPEAAINGPMLRPYWLFNDVKTVVRGLGKPGMRRWFELQYMGPAVLNHVVFDRKKHGNSLEALKPYIKKNLYQTKVRI